MGVFNFKKRKGPTSEAMPKGPGGKWGLEPGKAAKKGKQPPSAPGPGYISPVTAHEARDRLPPTKAQDNPNTPR